MSSRLLSFSLALNLVLLGVAGYWAGRSNPGDDTPAPRPISQTNHPIKRSLKLAPTPPATRATSAPWHWSELESEDYPTYVANLREARCPEPVLRRIIGAELKELYAQKAFALVQEFHRDFWEIAARENVRKYFDKTLRQQVNALCKEPDALLKQLVGESAPQPSSAPAANAPDSRLTDFLSSDKSEQLRQLSERYEAQLQAVHRANLSLAEKAFQMEKLREEVESEQARLLSPEEWAEYQLRQSGAASEVQQLYGVDFSETELRNLAKAIEAYRRESESHAEAETDRETLDQKLLSVLGPARFADLNRARSASYRELYETASDFGRPPETAAEIFDLRLASEMQSDEIRADKNRTAQEKQALLDALQEQVEQAVFTRFGAEAYQSYKAKDGRWIHSLGRL